MNTIKEVKKGIEIREFVSNIKDIKADIINVKKEITEEKLKIKKEYLKIDNERNLIGREHDKLTDQIIRVEREKKYLNDKKELLRSDIVELQREKKRMLSQKRAIIRRFIKNNKVLVDMRPKIYLIREFDLDSQQISNINLDKIKEADPYNKESASFFVSNIIKVLLLVDISVDISGIVFNKRYVISIHQLR